MRPKAKGYVWLATLAAALFVPEVAQAAQEPAGDGPDILPLALITTGAIFGGAALGLVLYLLRQRIGFWLHRPPESEPDKHEGEH